MEKVSSFQKYYTSSSYKYALSFGQVWIPSTECSLHRFTKASIRKSVASRIHFIRPKKPTVAASVDRNDRRKVIPLYMEMTKSITWLFIGDSALRGIFCGIIHVLEGSEVDGPCINPVCGGGKKFENGEAFTLGAVSTHVMNQLFEMNYFDRRLILKFIYTKSLNTDEHLGPLMLNAARSLKKGDTLIHNSGAWDFDKYARLRKKSGDHSVPPDRCHDDTTREIEQARSSESTIKVLLEMSKLAQKVGAQLIYRNNHYNERYGPLCADEKVEAALIGSRWEIFNNRDLSRDVWRQQCYDGFHFARDNIYTVEDHRNYSAVMFAKNGVYPGQLEMQLAQTLLFQILHSTLDGKSR